LKQYALLIAALLALCLMGCAPLAEPEPTTLPTAQATQPPTTQATQPPTGWLTEGGKQYYLHPDGTRATGWLEDGGETYYLAPDGFLHTGWLELEGNTYYLKEDGTRARGELEIAGVKHHFTSAGARVLVVNPWNYVPEGYAPELVTLPSNLATQGVQVSAECYDALMEMLDDCNAQEPRAVVVSGYRTQAHQTNLYNNKVARVEAQGYSHEQALIEAAKVVAIPGTSEHQLGLAVDIIDTRVWELEEIQETLPAQQWLMAHCWEYGFILRYPKDKTGATGIIYEPWHYRYVGKDLARELHDLGLTLEEYLESLT